MRRLILVLVGLAMFPVTGCVIVGHHRDHNGPSHPHGSPHLRTPPHHNNHQNDRR